MFNLFSIHKLGLQETVQSNYLCYYLTRRLMQIPYVDIEKINVFFESGFSNTQILGLDTQIINIYYPVEYRHHLLDACIEGLKRIWVEKNWPDTDINSVLSELGEPVDFLLTKQKKLKASVYVEYTRDSTKVFFHSQGAKENRIFIMEVIALNELLLRQLFHEIRYEKGMFVVANVTNEIQHQIRESESIIQIVLNPTSHTKEELLDWLNAYNSSSDIVESFKTFRQFKNS